MAANSNSSRKSAPSDDLHRSTQEIWEKNAAFWDEAMGEGNQFQRYLVGPASERLLGLQPGESVLEVACGNGIFARRMAELGARVVATDFSPTFIELARQRAAGYESQIEFAVVDAAEIDQLRALGFEGDRPRQFDAIVTNMALMDMVTIEPLFQASYDLLKPGGRMVFTTVHPCFNSDYCRHVAEEEDREGELVVTYAIKVTGYRQPRVDRGLGIIGQPEAQYYFHRSISDIFNTAFRFGFVLDGIEEPAFEGDAQPSRPFSWANYRGIPPVLGARLRKAMMNSKPE